MEKTVKEQINEATDELIGLLDKKVKRLKKRNSVKDAHGETVKQAVKNARGEDLNR
jgi:hypothetical protein